MELILEKLWGLILFTATLLILGLMSFRALQRNFDTPGRLIAKWSLTGAICYGYWFLLRPMSAEGGAGALYAVMIATIAGIALAVMWAPVILDRITRPIMDLFVGGWFADHSRPYYALAKGLRKREEFERAVAEIDAQLETFPEDAEGRLLKAEIQAEDLEDVAAARETLDELLELDATSAQEIGSGLFQLADWSLRIEGDPDAAENALQKLIGLLPETDTAAKASMLIKRIPDRDRLQSRPESRNALRPSKPGERVRVSKADAVAKRPPPSGDFDTVALKSKKSRDA